MFIHDCIKMLYSSEGYLPSYPYYLISDKEMFDAFLRDDGYFNANYYCPTLELQSEYDELVLYIQTSIQNYLNDGKDIPNWIYSYMIHTPITYNSSLHDLYYLNDMLHIDSNNGMPRFDEEVALSCFEVSKKWLQKLPLKDRLRPPTMFGEGHVIKSLRIAQANVLLT